MQRDDDGERGGGDYQVLNRQNQDRRLTDMQGENQQQQQQQQQQPQQEQQHHPHPPPQKCPRCDSVNTKFCYYNNYSLSQPRYFCKTCRRYWTQGGTLRNVPVGGGCRKGKRAKTSSSSSNPSGENSRSQPHPEPQHGQQNQLASSQSIHFSTATGNTASALGLRTNKDLSGSVVSSPGISSMGSYYPGGGFLSSLAAIQSLNSQSTQQSFHLNQPAVNLGGDSNLGLLHAFNLVPSFGSQQQHQRQFYHMGNREDKSSSDHHSFYPQESFNIQSTSSCRPAGSTSHHHQQQQNWHRQGFVSSGAINPLVADTALWSISTSTSTGGNANNNSTNSSDPASPPLNPDDQWHGLPGYGPPP